MFCSYRLSRGRMGEPKISVFQETTAILVDGAFYRRRAYNLFGDKNPKDRAQELVEYCIRHLSGTSEDERNRLYRIFYYDCPPMETSLFHPYHNKAIDMKKFPTYQWTKTFFAELANKRKVALRLGELQERESCFRIKAKTMNRICREEMNFSDLTEGDFEPNFVQKGVDMKIGLDVASLTHKKQVTQIVLIAGDSDFVPVAKHARREGIDFILDPMWQDIRPGLNEHIDGLHSCTPKTPAPQSEPLHIDYRPSQRPPRRKKRGK